MIGAWQLIQNCIEQSTLGRAFDAVDFDNLMPLGVTPVQRSPAVVPPPIEQVV